MFDVDQFMTYVPLIVISVLVSAGLSWLVIRSAVLSALRKHAGRDRVGRGETV